jgi:hypothetical protein
MVFSVFSSRADVGSSNMQSLGFFINIANAMRCFSPPDNFAPFSPTQELYWWGNRSIDPEILAFLAEFLTSSMENSGVKNSMLV